MPAPGAAVGSVVAYRSAPVAIARPAALRFTRNGPPSDDRSWIWTTMTKRLRTFLMLLFDEQWRVAVSNDLDTIVDAWTQQQDQRTTGIIHIGFEQIRARHFDTAVRGFAGQLLLTAGAKYALPACYGSTADPVVSSRGGELYLATHGWGWAGAAVEGAEALAPRPVRSQPDAWLSRFLADFPAGGQALAAAGIVDDASYQVRESTLSRDLRLEAGSYRFRFLCRDLENPCEIAAAAPPWLRGRRFDLMMSLTVRVANLFAQLDIEQVSDLDRFSTAELREAPHFGRKSARDLAGTLNLALAAGPLDCESTLPLAAIQKAGLLSAVTTSLLGLSERGRDILTRRMGLNDQPQTLREIGERHNLTSDRIRRIEVKTIDQWRAIALWDALLIQKVRQLLGSRAYPLPLHAVEVADRWFAGAARQPEAISYLLAAIPEAHAALIEIDGVAYLAQITTERWQALLNDARKLLLGAAGQHLTESRCRQLVEVLLPARRQNSGNCSGPRHRRRASSSRAAPASATCTSTAAPPTVPSTRCSRRANCRSITSRSPGGRRGAWATRSNPSSPTRRLPASASCSPPAPTACPSTCRSPPTIWSGSPSAPRIWCRTPRPTGCGTPPRCWPPCPRG